MARQDGPPPAGGSQAEREPGSAFRWPSRELATRSERQAAIVAERGLERLRARARKLRPVSPPPREPTAPPPRPPKPQSGQKPEPPKPEASKPEPPPAPWDAELDALTEELVAELRRDLGPEAQTE